MKYTLDTLPVLDAYRENSECPLCRLRIACEDQYVDSMLGAAYMEPDCRVKTNEVGFCPRHFQLMFERRNRLGLALMTHTHLQQVERDLKTILESGSGSKGLLASLRGGKSEDLTGIPITGSVVWPAITPARCAALPAAAMIASKPFSRAFAAKAATVSGVLCALATCTSTSISNPLSTSTQPLRDGQSLFEPIISATFGIMLDLQIPKSSLV